MSYSVNQILASVILVAVLIGLSACSQDKTSKPPVATDTILGEEAPSKDNRFSIESISRGAAVFQRNCAECHGPEAQGHPDWQPDSAVNNKIIVSPPLNGTGVTWKRSRQEIIDIVRNGVHRDSIPVMPAWKGRGDNSEIEDVVTWFQALWPPETYEHWQKAQLKLDKAKGS